MTENTNANISQAALSRRAELKSMLEDRRRELMASLHERMRGVRDEGGLSALESGLDEGEVSAVDVQEDIELALIQMKAEILERIDEAIARVDAGSYGQCSSCRKEIASARLRALPFAVRCRACEEQHETQRRRARMDYRRGHLFFMDRAPA